MKNLRITVNGNSYDVQVEELAAGSAPAPVAAAPVFTTVLAAVPAANRMPEPACFNIAPFIVRAPVLPIIALDQPFLIALARRSFLI